MDKSTHNARIELAIADLKRELQPNVRQVARKYELVESTLRRRWKGKSVSIQASSSTFKQRLTNAQEEALIAQINSLTARGMPPISQMVRNFTEEIIKDSVGKNWTGDFCN